MDHRPGCTFGPGYYRIELISGARRYCQTEEEVKRAYALLIADTIRRVSRDGYCLDPLERGDPDVVDGERFLNMPRAQAMHELGIADEPAGDAHQRALGAHRPDHRHLQTRQRHGGQTHYPRRPGAPAEPGRARR